MKKKHSGLYSSHFTSKGQAGMFLFFVCLFASVQLRGQSYFYFENKLPLSGSGALSYYTFLTVDPDGSGTARIRYTEPASSDSRLLELHLVDSVITGSPDNDDKYLVTTGGPLLIMGTGDSGFVSPRFVFKKQTDSVGIFYVPVAVEYKTADGNWHTAEMMEKQQKSIEDLAGQQDFVGRFFNASDEFYANLFFTTSRGSQSVRKEKLFLIAVANTRDSTIGVTSKKDLDNITHLFTSLTKDLGIKFISTNIFADGFNKTAVQTAIANLKPAPIDIVVFYYSGHGFRYSNDTSKYPRMSMRQSLKQDIDKNNLSVETVYKQIVKKGAKVNIVLSDCCNDDIGAVAAVGRNILRTRGMGAEATASLNMENCLALFFPSHPVSILTTAAEKNQLATGNPPLGGFFTNFFTTLLTKSLYSYESSTSWLRILLDAREKARRQALTAICGDGRCVQRAEITVVPPQ